METGSNVRRGFTLIEFIIVIALIALVGGLIVVNAEAILRGLGDEPVDRTLQKAVREARYQAAYLKDTTELRFDEESKAFIIKSWDGRELANFPTGYAESKDRIEVLFEQILPAEGLYEGFREDTVEVETVRFRPDRSSTPFQVIVSIGMSEFTQRYDPFSDIVIKDSREDDY